MTDHIKRRLADLEQRFQMNAPPTFEEFAELWQMLTPFDRACYHGNALDEDNIVLRGYLVRLGAMDESEQSLQQLAKELDNKNFDI